MGLNLVDGFGHHYRPESARLKACFHEGLIVLDTNVLLNVLRYSPAARDDLVGVIEAISSQCFVPHQIAEEYNRNRVKVVSDRLKEFEEVDKEIGSIKSSVRSVVNNLRDRRTLPALDIMNLEGSVKEFFDALEDASSEASEQYDLDPDMMVGSVDRWTTRLTDALAGCVAERSSSETLKVDVEEAERRQSEQLAPGFKDKSGGDYLWWAEVLRNPNLKGKPLVIVSDDAAKGDWRHEARGIPVGPQRILIEDVLEAGGTDLVLLTTRDLLEVVEDLGASPVSQATIAESERAFEAVSSDWTMRAYLELIDALHAEGFNDRSDVIRAAAHNDGELGRDEVYRIAGISESDRSLRQFATPVVRIARELAFSGTLPELLDEPLKAVYDGPGKAVGYAVPRDFVKFERKVRLTIGDPGSPTNPGQSTV